MVFWELGLDLSLFLIFFLIDIFLLFLTMSLTPKIAERFGFKITIFKIEKLNKHETEQIYKNKIKKLHEKIRKKEGLGEN